MNFESRLKQTIANYQGFLKTGNIIAARNVLVNQLQARGIFADNKDSAIKPIQIELWGTTFCIPAPGLCDHIGLNVGYSPQWTKYESRTNNITLDPEKNGYVQVYFVHDEDDVKGVTFEFMPYLTLGNARVYPYMSRSGEKLHTYAREEEDMNGEISLRISSETNRVTKINFKPNILRKGSKSIEGTLTLFFKDCGWQSLDDLVN
ncbi:hypothetical protein J4216_05540 [Candidatus Woesearchaeota archaeon]|nr:hypothetical protein [Candidatus Woesearchaeota archaeon]